MIKVLKDNTKTELYTICASCGSELSYAFKDVTIEELAYSYAPNRSIKCPACGKNTNAEMKAKDDYFTSANPIGQLKLPMVEHMCCCGKDK